MRVTPRFSGLPEVQSNVIKSALCYREFIRNKHQAMDMIQRRNPNELAALEHTKDEVAAMKGRADAYLDAAFAEKDTFFEYLAQADQMIKVQQNTDVSSCFIRHPSETSLRDVFTPPSWRRPPSQEEADRDQKARSEGLELFLTLLGNTLKTYYRKEALSNTFAQALKDSLSQPASTGEHHPSSV